MKRSAIKRAPKRRYRGDGSEARTAWLSEHLSCAVCWRSPLTTWGVVLHLHHVVGGNRSKPDFAWNWLRLCDRHHDWIHGLDNRVAVGMALKRESDREHYDRRAMVAWYQRFGTETVPRAARLPAYVKEARENWDKR
jgi:hypothetical protein